MKLGVDSIIEPGNFGRIITSTAVTFAANDGLLIAGYVGRELMFELIRERSFPEKPSRLKAVFECPALRDAHAYAAATNVNNRQVLHEVETIDETAAVHTGALSHCDIPPGVQTTQHRAELYWSGTFGDPSKGLEMIVESAIRVVCQV